MPGCTVVIPCYNDTERLAEAIASLQRQSSVDWEAMVVDDASTSDDVKTLVDGIHDERVKSVRHERNRGLAAARNTGIGLARSDLILPLDSDDRLHPLCLERLTSVLVDDPAVDAVFPDFRLFGEASGIQRFAVGGLDDLLVRQWVPGPGCMYRRRLWEGVGGYCEDEVLRAGDEDWDFWVSAAEAGFVARHVAMPLYEYRVTGTSMSHRMQYQNHVLREHMYARHRAFYDRKGRRREFLSEGYRASALASVVRRERRRALRLALHSLRLEPTPSGLAIVVRSLTPDWTIRLARRLRPRAPRA